MSKDLHILKRIEREIGRKFKKRRKFSTNNYSYQKDYEENVINLSFTNIGLQKVPQAIIQLKKLTELYFSNNHITEINSNIKLLKNLYLFSKP